RPGALPAAFAKEGRLLLLRVADASFRRSDFAIVVHRVGLFLALLFDDVGLLFHGLLRRAFGHGVGLGVDRFSLGFGLILDPVVFRALASAERERRRGGEGDCKLAHMSDLLIDSVP